MNQEQLLRENEDMKNDIKLIAKVVKSTLKELGFMNDSGDVKIDGRVLGKILPLAMSGKLSDQLSGFGEVIPLFEKYKHLID